MILSFIVRGIPAPQGSLLPVRSISTGRVFMKQSCARTMPWRQEVAACAAEAAKRSGVSSPSAGPIELKATFLLPRPAGHFGKKGLLPSAPRWPIVKPDGDKLKRAVMDALTGVAYVDDKQVVRWSGEKNYVGSGEFPSAWIEVRELDPDE